MNIGGIIKYRRQKQNMTQGEVAALLNVTPQAISRWEMNISYPDIAMVPKISEVLKVSADELLGIKPLWETDCRRQEEATILNETDCRKQEEDPILNQSQADSIFDYVPIPSEGRGRKVLVTDDAEFMRMILTDILTSKGHTVLLAENGQECLNILQKETVDVCVLDIGMPVMDGMETLRRIKKEHPDLKVIMLSARSQESSVKLTLALGADAFVVKPFQEECLIQRTG